MGTVIRNITFDCADPYGLAHFWAKVFDCPVDPQFTPEDEEVALDAPGNTLWFQQRFERRGRPTGCTSACSPRCRAIRRSSAYAPSARPSSRTGAIPTAPVGWCSPTPEGNEFCVLRSAAERQATG